MALEGHPLAFEGSRRPAIDDALGGRCQDGFPIGGQGDLVSGGTLRFWLTFRFGRGIDFDGLIAQRQFLAHARARGRSVSFFLYGSLVPLFFYVPLLSRYCPGRCPTYCPGVLVDVLIFVVITDGYDEATCPGIRPDHRLGF